MRKALTSLVVSLATFASLAHADERLIIVGGSAEKSLDPNMVIMNVEVWSKAPTAKQAQQLAANQYKQVKKTFDDFKIKKEDIQTDNYALNPEYIYDQKTQQNKMVGFRVVNNVIVTFRKVDEAGNFLDALVVEKKGTDSGVNVNNINWDSDQRSKVETAALADAVRAAKIKAEEIAKAAGVKIKNVARISHGATNIRPPMPMARGGFAMKAAMADSAPTELSAGQIKVRVDVTAEYEIN
ncbi:SIMPL domain-containing protein [Bdellovibrio svalbardensis]|uniref:SIMPL domain-containing protein n=1 Tax=Bdellovibrio svalbardensis TaxID=2972972 RepID=A0ABT6DG71_9BACT|nr:SIMPL domain-containing protein [Bdellovibrio svalbardensis]MDG0815846.1 SIMPL domain-containing protein [Bdellovibrio svalbardensis]